MPEENSKIQVMSAEKKGELTWWKRGKDAVISRKTADTVLKITTNPHTFSMDAADSETDSITVSVAVRWGVFVCGDFVVRCGKLRDFTVYLRDLSIDTAMEDSRQESQSFIPVTLLPSRVSPTPATVKPMPGFEQRGRALSASSFVQLPSLYSSLTVFAPKGNPPTAPRISAAESEPFMAKSFSKGLDTAFLHISPKPLFTSILVATEKRKVDGSTFSAKFFSAASVVFTAVFGEITA